MSKKNIVEEEVEKFGKTRTGKAMSWLGKIDKVGDDFTGSAKKAKKTSPGNGAGSRVVTDADDEKAPFAKGRTAMLKKRENKKMSGFSQDVNLPNEKKVKDVDAGNSPEQRRRKSTGSRLVE